MPLAGLIAPAITLMVLDLFPNIRGTVASCQSFVQTMMGAIVAGVVAPALDGSVLMLAAGQLVFALAGFFMMFLRSLQVSVQNWRQGYSILENPAAYESLD